MLCAATVLFACSCAERKPQEYNIRAFGAFGDGKTLDTTAINNAMKACARKGGGIVTVPPGEYRSGTIQLLSNVNLHLEAGAVIRGSPNLLDYALGGRTQVVESTFEQPEYLRFGLIVAEDANNVAITGRGVIDGNGDVFMEPNTAHDSGDYDKAYTRQGERYAPRLPDGPISPIRDSTGRRLRPGTMVLFNNCRNILIRDVTMVGAANWALHLACCDDAEVAGVIMHHSTLIPNADGIDVSNCHNVRIADCDIIAGDDGIAMGACGDNFCGRTTENITVTNCTIESRSAGIRVGYANYDVRNCTFENLVIHSTNRGIGLFVRGTQSIENILFSNIVIQTRLFTGWWGNGEPIHISTIRAREDPALGQIRNVRFSNIVADGEAGIVLYGCQESIIRDVFFDSVGLTIRNSPLNESFGGNFDLRPAFDRRFGVFKHDIPGLYAGYVDGLEISGLQIAWDDNLPEFFNHAIWCENFKGVTIDGFVGRQAHIGDNRAAIVLDKGSGATIRNCRAAEGTGIFLQTLDVNDGRLFVNNDLSKAQQTGESAESVFREFGNSESK